MPDILSREDILSLLGAEPPLVENLCDVAQQLQPNGIDLTARELFTFSSRGSVPVDNRERVLSDTSPLPFDSDGGIELTPGCYLVTYNEVMHLPADMIALALPRSSLLRCGVSVHTAVWDAGYSGRSQSLMVVYNSSGFHLQKNARIVQLIFLRLGREVAEGYHGIFQGENT